MLYRHHAAPFGDFVKHTISDPLGQDRITLVPGCSCTLLELTLAGQAVGNTYHTPEEMIENSYAKNVLLFPFPNRLRDGKYDWNGKQYQFPLSAPDRPFAIHGFGRRAPFKAVRVQLRSNRASITCRYTYDGHHDYYPFPFILDLTFTLHPKHRLEITVQVYNHGEQVIPFGFGWHPYFTVAEKVSETVVQLPASQMVEVDAQAMLPTGNKTAYNLFDAARPMQDTKLDNCFHLTGDQAKNAVIHLAGPNGTLECLQETGKFPYFQVFTPPHFEAIAVEPMSCNVDAFNNHEGLWKVAPGEKAKGRFGLRFIPK